MINKEKRNETLIQIFSNDFFFKVYIRGFLRLKKYVKTESTSAEHKITKANY